MPNPNDPLEGSGVQVVVIDSNELRRDWRAKLTRVTVGWALAALGAVLILIGYLGVAHEALVAKQIPYLVSGGIGGMVLVAVGAFLLGTDDVRKQLARVEQLETMVEDLHRTLLVPAGSPRATPAPPPAVSDDTPTSGFEPSNGALVHHVEGLVALARGKSFHRAGCSMVAGKAVDAVDLTAVRTRGLRPCPLCAPEPIVAAG